jgi:hypothetical protein
MNLIARAALHRLVLFVYLAGFPTQAVLGQSLQAIRGTTYLDSLERGFLTTSAPADQMPDRLNAKFDGYTGRFPMMQLESFTDLYRPEFGKELRFVDKLASDISDQLSAYGDAFEFHRWAQEGHAPDAVVQLLAGKLAHQRGVFAHYLDKFKWLQGAGAEYVVPLMRERIRKIDWPSQKKDRKFVLEELIASFKEARDMKVDFEDIESVHRFRRHVRWCLIKMSSSLGLFVGDSEHNPVPDYVPMLKDEEMVKKVYAQLPANSAVNNPIKISRSVFLRSIRLIDDLGVAKDIEVCRQTMAKALKEVGAVDKKLTVRQKADAIARNVRAFAAFFDKGTSVQNVARRIHAEIKNTVIPALLKDLKANRDA